MRFLRPRTEKSAAPLLVFQITRHEKAALLATLQHFPVLEAAHHRLTKTGTAAGAAEQRLLEEAMAQRQFEHKRKLDEFFRAPEQFFRNDRDELHLTLTAAQLEWLLQVLNDIRVGSWVQLGCPELDYARLPELAREKPAAFTAMETSGIFQSVLLEAFA
ncbi:MAG: hypothetical protein ABSH38_19005 [Verrucomicrobiota bacterium]|jgi:hypothetical protein